jgi:hypothetical protein
MAKFKKDILKLVQIFFIFLSANMKGKLIKRQPRPQEIKPEDCKVWFYNSFISEYKY